MLRFFNCNGLSEHMLTSFPDKLTTMYECTNMMTKDSYSFPLFSHFTNVAYARVHTTTHREREREGQADMAVVTALVVYFCQCDYCWLKITGLKTGCLTKQIGDSKYVTKWVDMSARWDSVNAVLCLHDLAVARILAWPEKGITTSLTGPVHIHANLYKLTGFYH